MKLSSSQYEYIKGEVVSAFERYSVNCIPISGFELAYKMGIKLIPYSSLPQKKLDKIKKKNPDGFYLDDGKGHDLIYYNDKVNCNGKINYSRINMTILHELGHCILDHTGLKEYEEVEEAETKFFAKYAAAPPPLLHRINATDPDSVELFFEISAEAARYAVNYYRKWLRHGGDYKEYEIRLLKLFKAA